MQSATSGVEVEDDAVLLALALAELAGFEDLLDGGEEAVGVGVHDGVEVLALGFVERRGAGGCPGRGGWRRWGS